MNERSTQNSHHDALRAALWSALVISAAGNTVASAASASLVVHLALGTVSALSAVGLLLLWKKARA